jgi:hypothetical protein
MFQRINDSRGGGAYEVEENIHDASLESGKNCETTVQAR